MTYRQAWHSGMLTGFLTVVIVGLMVLIYV